jgi:phosphatidylglycerophosphatase A
MLAITAFVMFRAFDIAKPPPARGWQRMTGGWGILIDDVIAGVYALIATQVVARIALPYVW